MTVADLPNSASRTASSQTADLTVVGGAGHVGVPLVLSLGNETMGRHIPYESRSDYATVALLILIAGLFCFDVMLVRI